MKEIRTQLSNETKTKGYVFAVFFGGDGKQSPVFSEDWKKPIVV